MKDTHSGIPSPSGLSPFFRGNSEMAQRMREFNWEKTALGHPATWPQPLALAISIILEAKTPFAIYWGPDFHLLYNDAWKSLIGNKHPSALGSPAREVFPEIWAAIEPMMSKVMSGRGAAEEKEQLLPLDRSGRIENAWFDFSYSPIRNADGTVAGILDIAHEITGKRMAEQKLLENEAFLKKVLSTSVAGLYIYDLKEGCVSFINEQYTRLTGYSFEKIRAEMQHDLMTLFHPDDIERIQEHRRALAQAAEGDVLEMEYRFRRADGKWIWLLSYDTVFARDDDGSVRQFLGTFIDLTERKMSEEQIKSALRENTILLKEVHHRVKNNMQIVVSLIDLQANDIDNEYLLGIFRDLKHRIRSMAVVHEKLYQSNRLEQINICDYGSDLLTYLWRSLGSRAYGIELKVEIEPLLIPASIAIPYGLILTELASNALKHAFSDSGKGLVSISFRRDDYGVEHLTVQDNGKGLPEDVTLETTDSLGLCLVKMLAGQISAQVELQNSDGACFKLSRNPGNYG